MDDFNPRRGRRSTRKLIALFAAVGLVAAVPTVALASGTPPHAPLAHFAYTNAGPTTIYFEHSAGCDSDFDFGNNPGFGLWGTIYYYERMYGTTTWYFDHGNPPSQPNCGSAYEYDSVGGTYGNNLKCGKSYDIQVKMKDLNGNVSAGTGLYNKLTAPC